MSPLDQLARRCSVGPEELLLREFPQGGLQYELRADVSGNVVRIHDQTPEQTERIDKHMSLSPLHLVAGIVPEMAPHFSVVFPEYQAEE